MPSAETKRGHVLFNSKSPLCWNARDLVTVLSQFLQYILLIEEPNLQVLPRQTIPFGAWKGTSFDYTLNSHSVSWWSCPYVHLIGFFVYRTAEQRPTITTCTFAIQQKEGGITGSGNDACNPYTLDGKYYGPRVVFTKRYMTWSWLCSGLLLPWDLLASGASKTHPRAALSGSGWTKDINKQSRKIM